MGNRSQFWIRPSVQGPPFFSVLGGGRSLPRRWGWLSANRQRRGHVSVAPATAPLLQQALKRDPHAGDLFVFRAGPMLSASSSRPVHHNITTSQVPAATKPAPAILEIRRPTG